MTRVRTVLFDRDSILADNPPGPDGVRPAPGAREALGMLRLHGVRTGFVPCPRGCRPVPSSPFHPARLPRARAHSSPARSWEKW